ncbi:phosphodiesterase [Aeromonas jandaei]|uniref:phosphodiesterase n=1 Tax=Aeromonas jandaei TaxID=650 RepID=UPI000F524F5B|nr:phosphodiesterase [Aeromonas jandaei]RQM74620.1 phosphodiesterase [Aeromonas jandaei]
MKLAIISDIHGSITALDQVLSRLDAWQPDHYLLLGDLLNHGPRNPVPEGYNPAAVAERLNELAPYIMAVRGNCDSEVDQMLLAFPITAPYNQLLVDGRRWFMSHGHLYRPDEVQLPADSVFLSGHSHVPVLERQGDQILMNPGSICFPRGELPASYGCYEVGVLSVKSCVDGRELLRLAL